MKIIDRCGRFLSGVVYRNIAILIATGILRILFSPVGWFPDPTLYDLVTPMMNVLVPVLFAYTGGQMIGDSRGGIIAAFVMLCAVYGSNQEYPMILASLVIGPGMGYFITKIDKWMENVIPSGFELLLYNAISAVVGVIFGILSFLYFGTAMEYFIHILMVEMQVLISSGLLPLIALLIEPGKVLFFNNTMNHGILEPLGISQLNSSDTSIFFMLETNPGPGIGMLLALFLYAAHDSKQDLKSAMTIQFIGGIHEVYFPYALRRPILIVPLILGGMAGNFIFYYFQAGLVATPSPGSILTYLALSPREHLPAIIIGIVVSASVSFCFSYLFLILMKDRASKRAVNSELHATSSASSSAPSHGHLHAQNESATPVTRRKIQTVVFACDGGLASSAMGAAKLKKALREHKIDDINVSFTAIDRIPQDADLVVVTEYLKGRTVESAEHAIYRYVPSLIADDLYADIIAMIRDSKEKVGGEMPAGSSLAETPSSEAEGDVQGLRSGSQSRLPLQSESQPMRPQQPRQARKPQHPRHSREEDASGEKASGYRELILPEYVIDATPENLYEAILTSAKHAVRCGLLKPSGLQYVLGQERVTSSDIQHGTAVVADYLQHSDVVSNPGIVMLRCTEAIVLGDGDEVHCLLVICGTEDHQPVYQEMVKKLGDPAISQGLRQGDAEAAANRLAEMLGEVRESQPPNGMED